MLGAEGSPLVVLDVLVAELPEEFTGPLGYGAGWVWAALAAVAVAVGYVAVVLLATRERGAELTGPERQEALRRGCLSGLDEVAGEVHTGALTARAGHQRLSELVRGYVEQASGLGARSMSLADLRLQAPHLVEAVALMYPPEFAPDDDGRAQEQFDEALAAARRVVLR